MKTIKFLAIVVVSAMVAFGVTMWVDAMNVFHYDLAFVVVFLGTAIGVASLLGALDYNEHKDTRYENIRNRTEVRKAA